MALERDDRFEVEFCASAAEAIERAANVAPDLLLLDSVMPDTTGVALYEELRRQPALAEVPVVFLTTQAETLDLSSFLKVGAIDVIPKPFDVATLADAIDEIWRDHWSGRKRTP